MEVGTCFLSLCAHSFVWWLLTNALGTTLVYVRFELIAASVAKGSLSDFIDLLLSSMLVVWFIAAYLTLLWPIFALLPQWWALTARQPQARRGRMLLVIMAPFALLATGQILWLHGELLLFTLCYLLTALGAAAWMFRQWLW